MSSSPYLPSLEEIFKKSPKRPQLKSGSHVASIPPNAPTTFTTAASLLRDAPEIDIDTEQITPSPSRRTEANRGRKKTARPTRQDIWEHEPTIEPILVDSSSPSDKPWQKFKTNKVTRPTDQPYDSKEPGSKAQRKKPAKAKTETISRHFSSNSENAGNKASANANSKGSELVTTDEQSYITPSEPAMIRRNDWTPPKTTHRVVLDSDSDAQELVSPIAENNTTKGIFPKLFEQYGLKDTGVSGRSEQPRRDQVLKKRKRIELVPAVKSGDQSSRETSPTKPKEETKAPKPPAPKKKIKTITEMATAPYALPSEPDLSLLGPANPDSLLSYFDSDGAVKALVEHQSNVMSYKKEKAKPAKKPSKSKRKSKAGTEMDPILLSPSSAMKQSSGQDFVFGTSSQLVEEESPTMLRELQVAMQESNRLDSGPFDEADQQGLWHAGARDVDGDLMEVELIDLKKNSQLASETPQNDHTTVNEESFIDIDDMLTPKAPKPAPNSSIPARPEHSHFFPSQRPSNTGAAEASGSGSSKTVADVARPKFELFTDAQLHVQISSYGFKPVKKRQAMIALLDQCWSSKNLGSTHQLSNSMSTSATANSPPKKQSATTSAATNSAAVTKTGKPRGRPKKKDVADLSPPPAAPESAPLTKTGKPRGRSKKKDVAEPSPPPAAAPKTSSPKRTRGRSKKAPTPKAVEIADSDMEDSASSRSSPEPVFSSPPPVDLSTTDEADLSLGPSPTDQQTQLFKHVTKAVTSAPRSRDPSNPSWHEKMLLYDPVIVEDLAVWLNSGELTRVGCDEEVSPEDVKQWCESKSVICLWDKNRKGKERKRF
ncbi:hypothetical protein F4780DRAFT_20014 [Xylariomycetidae sp. FL0641]|nr:hypothetical protein F4780DRAFT_20014 [Xylariomycetidae sp. FL0641]